MRGAKSVKVDYRIDLHGFTLEQAYSCCSSRLEELFGNGCKSVEVITGKSGQIRKEFLHWIENWGYNARIGNNDGSFIVSKSRK